MKHTFYFLPILVFIMLTGQSAFSQQNSPSSNDETPSSKQVQSAEQNTQAGDAEKINSPVTPPKISDKRRFSQWACVGISAGEFLVPGLGYSLSGQYGKAVGFGALRWILASNAYKNRESEHYQEEIDEIYKSEEVEGEKNEVVFNYNKETWDDSFYSSVHANIGFYNIWDLQEGDCEPHASTFVPLTAIFRPDIYGKRLMFWIPTLTALYFYHYDNSTNYTWYLGNGLKRETVQRDSAITHYTVGIGEETIFRGVAQKSFFRMYQKHYSDRVAHHLGIFTSSAIFGVAHNGQGQSASAVTAFFFGLYFGYAYQPTPGEFDLVTSIAIHTVWNLAVTFKAINSGTFYESDDPVSKDIKIPLANFYFEF